MLFIRVVANVAPVGRWETQKRDICSRDSFDVTWVLSYREFWDLESKMAEEWSMKAGRLYVGRWNERVRAKRCDAVDWGLLKRRDSKLLTITYTLELKCLKNLHETPFYVNRRILCWIFCSKAMGKGEFFRDENRTSNFTLWMSKISR